MGGLFDADGSVEMVFVDGVRFLPSESVAAGPSGPSGRGGGPSGSAAAQDDPDRPSDAELRDRIGPSYMGPYRSDAITVIRNATILTVTNGTIDNGTVVIRDGKIAEVGTNVSAPRGRMSSTPRGATSCRASSMPIPMWLADSTKAA